MAVVYPEGVWYSHIARDDVNGLLEHLRSGHAAAAQYGMAGHGTRDEPRGPDGAVDRSHPDFVSCARC